jgi:hypothetical protein
MAVEGAGDCPLVMGHQFSKRRLRHVQSAPARMIDGNGEGQVFRVHGAIR